MRVVGAEPETAGIAAEKSSPKVQPSLARLAVFGGGAADSPRLLSGEAGVSAAMAPPALMPGTGLMPIDGSSPTAAASPAWKAAKRVPRSREVSCANCEPLLPSPLRM